MAYTKTSWYTGDVITATKLNNMETGISNNDTNIGDLSNLTTTAKNTLVAAINEAAQSGGGGGSVSPYTSNPAALGTASPGSSANYSRGDHVHPKPSASDLGVIAAPANPSNGDYLKYNGSAWVAQSGGGGVTVDSSLSSSSTNPVQNKIITNALPSTASVSGGVISFKNGSNTTLFTVTLPLYNGGIG